MARARSLPSVLAVAPLLLLGCGERPSGDATSGTPATQQPARHTLAVPEPRAVTTRDGALVVEWQPVDGAIPVNEHFEVDVRVRRAEGGAPVPDAEVSMTCFMPAHGHGMLREPRTEARGDGTYRIRGFLLHMGVDWSISITVAIDGLASTADDAITL